VTPEPLPAEILAYYARAGEAARLFEGAGQIELARTQEIIQRHLGPGRSTVLDVGGGPGIYACWLAGLGHAVGISRFASLFDGLLHGLTRDPAYVAIVERDLADGQHRNPTPEDYFTTAYFHSPPELASEVARAGLTVLELLGVEGPGWLMPDLKSRWSEGRERELLLWAARVVEHEPTLLGLSPHLLAVARRPA